MKLTVTVFITHSKQLCPMGVKGFYAEDLKYNPQVSDLKLNKTRGTLKTYEAKVDYFMKTHNFCLKINL